MYKEVSLVRISTNHLKEYKKKALDTITKSLDIEDKKK